MNYIKGFNGVSYGVVYTVKADDVSNGFVELNFAGENNVKGLPFPVAFSVLVTDSAGVNVPIADAVITANLNGGEVENGYLKIEDGSATFALVADQIIYVTAQPARTV